MDFKKLHNLIVEMQFPQFRENQIRQAFFSRLVSDWDEVSVLPKDIREKLKEENSWETLEAEQIVKDKKNDSVKAVFKLSDGELIESVLIKHKDGRRTVCVSSQVGCPMNCSFCATGKGGFKRNLSRDEIVDQVIYFAREMKDEKIPPAPFIKGAEKSAPLIKGVRGITNVVFMGMGEPLLNYDEAIKAVKVLNDKEGFNLGARHISISTCGIVPAIQKLAGEKEQVNLALSLHAPNNQIRDKFMPVNKRYDIKSVFEAIDYYIKKTNRRVMVEYLLIEGVNDRERDAEELALLMQSRVLCYVNLIPYNATGSFKASSKENIDKFTSILKKHKIKFTIRHKFGEFIDAACGQLAGKRK